MTENLVAIADELKTEDDGLSLITETEYSIENLRDYIQKTYYADKCEFLLEQSPAAPPPSIEEICLKLKEFLVDKMTLEQIFPLFAATSMTYFLEGADYDNMDQRINLIYQTFSHVDTLNPLHIHLAAKAIWKTLQKEGDITYVFCILNLCKHFAASSETGKAISIALAWTILAEITETTTEMYCFHEFSEINVMLKEIDEEMLTVENSTQIIYILIQVIGFLINSVVFGDNQIFVKAGYRNYFKYKQRDLEELKVWMENLSTTLQVNVTKGNNYWDLRMSMREYTQMLTALLHDKITDMSDAGNEA